MQNPIDDLTYDWITILHSKAQGMHAYEKFIQDAREANADECVEFLEELQEQDGEMLEKVRNHVAKFLQKDTSAEAPQDDMSFQEEQGARH